MQILLGCRNHEKDLEQSQELIKVTHHYKALDQLQNPNWAVACLVSRIPCCRLTQRICRSVSLLFF
jgi:hypothetical protein